MAKKVFGLSLPMLLVGGAAAYILTRKRGRPAPPDGMGDVDGDGRVTEADAKLVAKAVGALSRGQDILTSEQYRRANVTRSGRLSVVDALFIGQYATGERDSF